MTAAIAQHLSITESAILRVEEWSQVLFVVARGLGGRFVSKKYQDKKMNAIAQPQLYKLFLPHDRRGTEWVAQITDYEGSDFNRLFIGGSKAWSNRARTRYSGINYVLQPGSVYEVNETDGERYYAEVVGEALERLTREQVAERLAAVGKYPVNLAAKSAEIGLPALEGSERQVAWAEKIRSATLDSVEGYVGKIAERAHRHCLRNGGELTLEQIHGQIRDLVLQTLSGKNQARWWIDNRTSAGGGYGALNEVSLQSLCNNQVAGLLRQILPANVAAS